MRQRLSLTTLAITVVLALSYLFGLPHLGDNLLLDSWFRLRGERPHADDIIIVALDQTFRDEYPYRVSELDRRFYAQAVQNLTNAGAKVIGIDFFFPEASSDPSADQALADALLSANVILPHARQSTNASQQLSSSDHVPFNPLLEGVNRGVLELKEGARTFSPVIAFTDKTLPSFVLAIIRSAGLESNRDTTGTMLIDYRGPAGSFPSLSFLSAYRNQFAYSDVQNKIVILGVTLEGTDRDQITTAYGEMAGVEVNANQIYSLLHGRLVTLNPSLYALILIFLGLLCPSIAKRPRGLIYSILAVAGIALASYLSFLGSLFFSPLSMMLLPLVAYVSGSYKQLKTLDTQLSGKLIQLLDKATLAEESTVPSSLSQGFAPTGYVSDASDMLESLQEGLGADAGILFFGDQRTQRGIVKQDLQSLAEGALLEKRSIQLGTMPHYIAEPLMLDGQAIGVLALSLPAPPPPHMQALLNTSVHTFSQLARYQQLRQQTNTLAGTVWPWRTQSSQAKLNALSMISDLLATERGWLGTLLENLPQAIFIMSPYGYSIYKNSAARRLFGEERNMLHAIPEALSIEARQFQPEYVQMVEQGDRLEFGLTERKQETPLLLSLKVVRDDTEVTGVAGILSDLSKLSELDQKRQDMIAMVVHDLRSPLTSIQGFAELLLLSAEESDKEYLEIIGHESARMRRMTDAFLDISRLESDSFEIERAPANLAELLRHAVAAVSAQAGQKNILIALDAPPFLEANVDADLLSRMMINLLSNAIKYSSKQTRVTTSLKETDISFEFSVKDEGHGMSDELQAELFQKYKRGAEKQIVGTGLGLYLVKLIVDAHKGKIELFSKEGEGSTFTILLAKNTTTLAQPSAAEASLSLQDSV